MQFLWREREASVEEVRKERIRNNDDHIKMMRKVGGSVRLEFERPRVKKDRVKEDLHLAVGIMGGCSIVASLKSKDKKKKKIEKM